jgi:hypothetical protein
MKLVCLAVLLFVSLVASENTIAYAGTTTGGNWLNIPTFGTNVPCSASSATQSQYVVFNATFPTAGVREIAAMAEDVFKYYLNVYIYTTFSPASPCNDLYIPGLEESPLEGGPVIDDYIYFNTGVTYYFVITGTEQDTNGTFAIQIFPSLVYGITTASSPVWNLVTGINGAACDTVYYDEFIPFAVYSWTQPTSGLFDIVSVFYNATQYNNNDDWSTYIALYQGTIANLTTLEVDPCNNTFTGAIFISSYYENFYAAHLYYQTLAAGTTYTAVFSGGYYDEFGYWGLQVNPTIIRFPNGSGFTQPERDTFPCTVDTDNENTAAWGATVFLATQSTYLIDTGYPPPPFNYFDTYSFLYIGNNSGSSIESPQTCPLYGLEDALIIGGDTGDVTPVYTFTVPGALYTVIVSTYSEGAVSSGAAYTLYVFTGLPIGSIPVPTSAAATSGQSGVIATGPSATIGGVVTGPGPVTIGGVTGPGAVTGPGPSTSGTASHSSSTTSTHGTTVFSTVNPASATSSTTNLPSSAGTVSLCILAAATLVAVVCL